MPEIQNLDEGRAKGRAKTTRLTKTRQPVMNTVIEIWVDTINTEAGPAPIKAWEKAWVVGKGYGKGGNADLVMVVVEWADGVRQRLPWPDLEWREVR